MGVLPSNCTLSRGTQGECDGWCLPHQSQFHGLGGSGHRKATFVYGLKMVGRARVLVTSLLAS